MEDENPSDLAEESKSEEREKGDELVESESDLFEMYVGMYQTAIDMIVDEQQTAGSK